MLAAKVWSCEEAQVILQDQSTADPASVQGLPLVSTISASLASTGLRGREYLSPSSPFKPHHVEGKHAHE